MNIEMEIGMWFDVSIDEDGDMIIEMPYDNNGNGIKLVCKKNKFRYVKGLKEDLSKVLK
jgi:hypothetical protein